jgi:hypothetical protein
MEISYDFLKQNWTLILHFPSDTGLWQYHIALYIGKLFWFLRYPGLLVPKSLFIIWLIDLLTLSVPDECYNICQKHVMCTISGVYGFISFFVLRDQSHLSLRNGEYEFPSAKCFNFIFRKPNKTTINKNKTITFYRHTSFRFSFIFRYFKIFQVYKMYPYGLSGL